MDRQRRYPIGIQTFSEIVENGYVYIDKTPYIYRLAHSSAKFFFLSRPRRFGKSLLTSTLHSYFAGQRELFKGLAIEGMETEWTQHPVLHFDMSGAKHMGKDELERYLDFILRQQEQRFNISNPPQDANNRLSNLIIEARRQTGQQAVVLIDEYDAPLLDVVHEDSRLPELRRVMRNFYSPLKLNEPNLRLVFLTGITRFAQLSIFSELNNITNISMREEYAAICGITHEEMLTQMAEDIDHLAGKLGKSREETIAALRRQYDGYHFTWPSPDIYNPFSLLNSFEEGKLNSYWFGSGTPTYLIEMMRKFKVQPTQIGPMEAEATDFDAPTETMTSLTPLLYQSGYITIKGYDAMFGIYSLDIPNYEVEIGLMRSLIPYYIMADTQRVNSTIANMARALYNNDTNGLLRLLQSFLATVPYTNNTHYEGHYQQVLYIVFSLLGAWADVEIHTPTGRVDVAMEMNNHLYIFELKVDGSAEDALKQIDLKGYSSRFALSNLPTTRVGVSFDSKARTISDWKIAE